MHIIWKCKTISPHLRFLLFSLHMAFNLAFNLHFSNDVDEHLMCLFASCTSLIKCLNFWHVFTWVICFLIIEYWDWLVSWYIQRNQIFLWNYSRSICRLLFHSSKDAFVALEDCILIKYYLSICSFVCTFDVISRKSSHPRPQKSSSCVLN